jgi:hypothetical protein
VTPAAQTAALTRVTVPFSADGRTAPWTWAQWHMEPALRGYGDDFAGLNLPRTVSLGGDGADLADVLTAVQYVTETWESVRTLFTGSGGKPEQLVDAEGVIVVEVLDAAPGQAAAAAAGRARELAAGLFNHAREYPVRFCAVRDARDGRVRFVALAASHLAFDGWSIGRLAADLAVQALGDSGVLKPPVQPADEAAWEASQKGQRRSERTLEHWRARLAELPPRCPRPGAAPEDPRWQRWAVHSPVTADRAAELARLTRTSTGAVMLTLAAIAAAQLQGQDIAGLLLISGNRITLRERLIGGAALQDAIMTVRYDPGLPLTDMVRRVYPVAAQAYSHGRVDPAALRALRAEAAGAAAPDLSWFFNDARLGREWECPAGALAAGPFFVQGFNSNDMTFCLSLAQRGDNCEVALLADTAVLSAGQVRGFLTAMGPLLHDAAGGKLTAGEAARALLGAPCRLAPEGAGR